MKPNQNDIEEEKKQDGDDKKMSDSEGDR